MKNLCISIALAICGLFWGSSATAGEYSWKAKWISKEQCTSEANTWLAFRKDVHLDKVPQSLVAHIAADSKYWLWINDKMVVFEGGLKRGPAPGDGYYDEVEIAPYLKPGTNRISILLWYFGRAGFSHMSSGIAAMIFDARAEGIEILSDKDWGCEIHSGYGTAHCPATNYRLPESNVRYDANAFPEDWYRLDSQQWFGPAIEIGIEPGLPPFGKLVRRPVPLWKDFGYSEYVSSHPSGDTLFCHLPYNCQFSPCLKVKAPAGRVISMITDHDYVTEAKCVSGEYVTREGIQEYEHLPWMNGDMLMYIVPSDVQVIDVGFHETGYATEFAGTFSCDDTFLNDYWEKAVRTMYVNMRDSYFDCPDRERAQWFGDIVNDLNTAFYCFDRNADLLAVKGYRELVNWQKPDGVLCHPVPCSNYFKELPMQLINVVGWYGLHNLWYYSGDDSFVAEVYEPIHRYLHEVWQLDSEGLPIYRIGDWDWPDEGQHRDRQAQLNIWYYLALKSEAVSARMLGRESDALENETVMLGIAEKFNRDYWNGNEYRSPDYDDPHPDDRVQALAVISGIAAADKYPAIKDVLSREYNATTYMFPYVLDALFTMGEAQMALDRMKKMYPTVMKDGCSTLYEHWNHTGSCNHAWTSGAIVPMFRQLAGVDALEPGYRRFRLAPQMGPLKHISASFETKHGRIAVQLDRSGKKIKASLVVPDGTQCEVRLHNGKVETLEAGIHKVTLYGNN